MMKSLLIIFALLAVVALLCSCAGRTAAVGRASSRAAETVAPVAASVGSSVASPHQPLPLTATRTLANVDSAPPSLAVAAPAKTRFLTWDANGMTSWTLRTGPAREQYTNTMTVTTNAVLHQLGVYYKVETAPGLFGYWPSNIIYATYVQVTDSLRPDIVREDLWFTWTNHVEGPPQQFLRTRTVQTGWQ